MRSFTPTLLSAGSGVPGGATFQSHNQPCARTAYGYFFTAIIDAPGPVEQDQTAVLWFSADGLSFQVIDAFGPFGGGCPAVVADQRGDVYWIIVDDQAKTMHVHKRTYSDGSSGTNVTSATYQGFSTKWCAMWDEHNNAGSLYALSFITNQFISINPDLSVYDQYQLFQAGPVSCMEYPYLAKDQDIIIAGWTSSPVAATTPFYDGIRWIVNNQGGHRDHWYSPDTGATLTLPVVADDTGPVQDKREGWQRGKSTWCAAFAQTNRLRTHFAFQIDSSKDATDMTEQAFDNPGQSFTWYETHARSGINGLPVFGGETIRPMHEDGFYFKGADGALYFVSASLPCNAVNSPSQNNIVVLRSADDGKTWDDFAQSTSNHNPYAISGMRQGIELTGGGWANADQIVGMFTDIVNPTQTIPQKVYAFIIPLG